MSVVLLVVVVFAAFLLMRTVRIVPQKQVKIIERLGRYHRTAEAGLNIILPFEQAANRVRGATGGKRHDHAHRPRREGLGGNGAGEQGGHGGRKPCGEAGAPWLHA